MTEQVVLVLVVIKIITQQNLGLMEDLGLMEIYAHTSSGLFQKKSKQWGMGGGGEGG